MSGDLLTELLAAKRTVEELARVAGLSLSGTSHNLRILRNLRLVRGRREGRHVRYELYDHHVAELLAAIRHHREHVHPPAPVELPRRRAREPLSSEVTPRFTRAGSLTRTATACPTMRSRARRPGSAPSSSPC